MIPSNLVLMFSGWASTFVAARGVASSTADVTSRWIKLKLDTDTSVTCSAGAEYRTRIAGVVSSWGSIERVLSGSTYFQIRGDASALYETGVDHVLTVDTTELTFTVTTMLDPAVISDVTFGGEAVTFDGDPAVTF